VNKIFCATVLIFVFAGSLRSDESIPGEAAQSQPSTRPLHESVQVAYVNVTITALDKHGRYINDLRPDEFLIQEDGIPQKITDFSHYTPDQATPRTIGFVVDNSQSMSGAKNSVRKLDLALASVRKILSTLNPEDSLSLLLTNHGLKESNDIISREDLSSELDQITVHGGVTYLLDDMSKMVHYLADKPGRRFLIVCSDGQDNASKAKLSDIMLRAHAADLTIISVGTIESDIAPEWGNSAKIEQQKGKKLLEKIADETGGTAFFPLKAEDVVAFPEDLNRLLASQYYVSYQSANTTPGWHDIAIKCTRRSVKELRYRKGYVWQENSGA